MDEYPDSHLSEDVHKSHHKFCTKCGSDIVKIKRHSFCPGCGAEDEGKKFCPECGTPLHIHQKHEELTENGIEVAPVTKKSIRTEPVVEVEAQAPLQPQMQPISNQYPPASAPASSGYAQQPMQAPAPPQSPPPQVCPLCGNAATYMPQYSQWYCYNCKKYYIPSNPQPAPPPPLQAQQPAQAVPHQQNSYGFGKFVDVVKSLMPSWGEMKSSMEQAAEEEEKTGRPGAAGKAAEEKVAAVFKAKHYRIIRRDWQTQYGECDIIAARGSSATLIECKFRKAPMGIADFRSYSELFRWIKRQSIDGSRVDYMIIIAPIGGVSQQVRNEMMANDTMEVWEEEKFRQECEKLE